MTKTFEELEAKVNQIAERFNSLEKTLLGDLEMQAKYEAGKLNYPSMKPPPPGALDSINATLEVARVSIDTLRTHTENAFKRMEERVEVVRDLNRNLEAFFGPMLKGRNPPLDGNEVATKAYVDGGIARIAQVIREELQAARELAGELLSIFNVEQVVKLRAQKLRYAIQHVIEREKVREDAEMAAANRPSRLSSLLYAVTGLEKRNGERR